jgi:hypothetical protein
MENIEFSPEELDALFQPTFKVWSTLDLLESEFPPTSWIVDQLIPIPGLTFIAGKPGHGKSLFTLSVIKDIGIGSDFAQRFQTEEHASLLIDLETPPGELQKRFKLLNITDENPISIISTRNFVVTDGQHINEVLNWLLENNHKVVVIDCLIRSNELDENSSKDMRLVKKALDPLLDAGIAVIVLHHQGKYGSEQKEHATMRGSSDLEGMADSVLLVNMKGRTVTITQTKNRNAPIVPAFELDMQGDGKESLEFVYLGEDSTNKLNLAKRAIPELLNAENGSLNQKEICQILAKTHDLPINKVRTALNILVAAKTIVRVRSKNGHRYSLWSDE